MTARTKTKTVKKKPTATAAKKKPAAKKPPAKKSPPKPISKPGKKKPGAKGDAKPAAAAKVDPRKAAAPAKPVPSLRELAYAGAAKIEAKERVKKAPKVRPSRVREPGKRPDLPLPTPVERPGAAAGSFGEKYICFKCRAKFYDLGKPEPICPKCGANQREAPRQVRPKMPPPVAVVPDTEMIEERPAKRSRLLDEDEDEIVVDTDTPDDLDLGLSAVDEAEDFSGEAEAEEEEEEEAP